MERQQEMLEEYWVKGTADVTQPALRTPPRAGVSQVQGQVSMCQSDAIIHTLSAFSIVRT